MLEQAQRSVANYRAIADKIEEKYVRYPHTEEDKQALEHHISKSAIRKAEIEQQIKDLQEELKPELDRSKKAIANSIISLKRGYDEEKQECYGIANQESGQMEWYTADGTLVDSRRLLPEERQTFLDLFNLLASWKNYK